VKRIGGDLGVVEGQGLVEEQEITGATVNVPPALRENQRVTLTVRIRPNERRTSMNSQMGNA
jgi:hypothetical protein